MPEVSSLVQRSQIGVEATPGTAVAASKRLQSLSLIPSPQVSNQLFTPAGNEFPTVAALGRDVTTFDTPGQPTYDELPYVFSSLLGAATVTTPDSVNAPTARTWAFESIEDRKTYTVEHGDSTRARRAAYLFWQAFGLELGAENISSTGTAMARSMTLGVALTANPTSIPLVPVLRSQFSFYNDATAAALGTTKLLRNFTSTWSMSDVANAIFPIDAAVGSTFAGHVKTKPTATIALRPSADAVGEAFLNDLRAGSIRFIRMEAVGPLIAGTTNYRLRVDGAYFVQEAGGYDDETGVFVSPFTLHHGFDATWGKALRVEITNTLAAL